MKKRKIHSRVIAVVLTMCLCFSIQASATEADLKKQQKETQRQLDEINNQMKTIESQQKAVLAEIDSLGSELMELVMNLEILAGDLELKQEELEQAKADYEAAKKREEEQYEAMKLRIKFMYEEGDASFIETLVSAENFSDLINKAEYVQNVHSYDRNMLNEYVETKKQVQELKTTLETEMSNLESLQVEFEAQKDTLDTTIENKKDEISNLDEQIQIAVEKAAEEQRKREEEARKKAEEERRAAEARAQGGQGESAGTTTSPTTNNPAPTTPTTPNPSTPSPSTPEAPTTGGNTATAQKIVNAAYSQLGVPYVWGGSTPGKGLDCSGLVQYCHAVAGISLPHYSESQYAGGKKVSSPQPGDICWKPGHVGIYIGNGQMIEAQRTGTNIMISAVRAQGYARYW